MSQRELGPARRPVASARRSTPREITAKDKDVVVIGGGDTGADCVGNALREGARSIVQLELLPEPPPKRPDDRTPWPEWPLKYRLSYAMEEAKELDLGEQDYSVTTVRFADDGAGTVASLRIAQAAPAPPFAPVQGTEKELPAQLVLLAMGFLGPEQALLDQLRRGEGPARKREGGQALHDVGRRRVRRRRRPPRTVADRVGDQRGPPVRADGRSLSGGEAERRGASAGELPEDDGSAGHADADAGPEGPPQHVGPGIEAG